MPALNTLATTQFDATRTYGDVVRFVHVYVVEPHPMAPDPSPYRGDVWEADYSQRAQPRAYGERVALAKEVAMLLEGNQLMLVDDLTPETRDNPLWCSYGPAPNSAYLIGQDGELQVVQRWVSVDAMRLAIDQLLRH